MTLMSTQEKTKANKEEIEAYKARNSAKDRIITILT